MIWVDLLGETHVYEMQERKGVIDSLGCLTGKQPSLLKIKGMLSEDIGYEIAPMQSDYRFVFLLRRSALGLEPCVCTQQMGSVQGAPPQPSKHEKSPELHIVSVAPIQLPEPVLVWKRQRTTARCLHLINKRTGRGATLSL